MIQVLTHNRCIKSKKYPAYLEERNIAFTVRKYRIEPLQGSEIFVVLEKIRLHSLAIIWPKEPTQR